jgi:ABC-type multidrug transport system ATPase subunit
VTGGGVSIEADHVTQTVRGGSRVLEDVSITVGPGLVALIGASGVGKTMLLETLAGVRLPSAGLVRYFGVPEQSVGRVVGYVPQDDIVHRDLPLAVMLGYAARLRLPAGTTAAQIQQRVDDVLTGLGLVGRARVRVGSLSGGERKRASIGVELLTRPTVFFLDEPTSGLDPVTAQELMQRLRGLAEDGITVVMTTHHARDAEACDQLVVLGQGGRPVFSGAPDEALAHFGVTSVEDIYHHVDQGWSERANGSAPARSTVHPASRGESVAVADARPARPIGPLRQCLVLARRTVAILVRNRLTLGILLGSPLVILAMFLMLFRSGAFEPETASPSTEVMILFWIAFGGFFFGLTYGLLQICTEVAIVRRERLAGVRPMAYVLSKVLVLTPLLALVDLVLLGLLRLLDRLPALALGRFAEMYLTLVLATVAALGLGLLCSAAVSEPAQATLALPMLCFPQVLFAGAILPVTLMAPVGRWLSYGMSNRWTFEALGHTAQLPARWSSDASALGPPLLADYGDTFDAAVWQNWSLLAGFAVVAIVGTWAVLLGKGRRERHG